MDLPDGYTPARINADDLTFDELDRFVELTGSEIGKAPTTKMMRGLAVLALNRAGIPAGMDDLGPYKLGDILDVNYLQEQGAKADPTAADA